MISQPRPKSTLERRTNPRHPTECTAAKHFRLRTATPLRRPGRAEQLSAAWARQRKNGPSKRRNFRLVGRCESTRSSSFAAKQGAPRRTTKPPGPSKPGTGLEDYLTIPVCSCTQSPRQLLPRRNGRSNRGILEQARLFLQRQNYANIRPEDRQRFEQLTVREENQREASSNWKLFRNRFRYQATKAKSKSSGRIKERKKSIRIETPPEEKTIPTSPVPSRNPAAAAWWNDRSKQKLRRQRSSQER